MTSRSLAFACLVLAALQTSTAWAEQDNQKSCRRNANKEMEHIRDLEGILQPDLRHSQALLDYLLLPQETLTKEIKFTQDWIKDLQDGREQIEKDRKNCEKDVVPTATGFCAQEYKDEMSATKHDESDANLKLSQLQRALQIAKSGQGQEEVVKLQHEVESLRAKIDDLTERKSAAAALLLSCSASAGVLDVAADGKVGAMPLPNIPMTSDRAMIPVVPGYDPVCPSCASGYGYGYTGVRGF